MKKTQNNLVLISMLFVVSLVIANVVSAKILYTGLSLGGSAITLPGAALVLLFNFLINRFNLRNLGVKNKLTKLLNMVSLDNY